MFLYISEAGFQFLCLKTNDNIATQRFYIHEALWIHQIIWAIVHLVLLDGNFRSQYTVSSCNCCNPSIKGFDITSYEIDVKEVLYISCIFASRKTISIG